MRLISIKQALLATGVLAVAALVSPGWSPSGGLSLTVDSAQARVGARGRRRASPALHDEPRVARWWEERP
jgi:hypothetical protein